LDVKLSDAYKVSASIIKRRIATVNAMKAVFGVIALAFGKAAGKFERPGRTFRLPTRKATMQSMFAQFIIRFDSKRGDWPGGTRPNASQDVAGKERIAMKALQRGIAFVVRDMREYVERKLQPHAKRVSGRAA
jgi:hypothetical protein